MITLKEIAQEAGVSTTTVSNVLNGNSSRVSADTAERIQAIMKRSGYVPNQAARSLAQRESHVVAIIVQASPGENIFRNPYTAEYVGALTLELQQNGYYPLIRFSDNYKEIDADLRGWNVAGVIFSGAYNRHLHTLKSLTDIPTVFTDCYVRIPGANHVGMDDDAGGQIAGEYLIHMGHRQVGFLGNNVDESDVDGAVEGVTFLYMQVKGLLEIRGKDGLIRPYVELDGQRLPLHPAWSREHCWIPRFVSEEQKLRFTCTYLTPVGERALVLRLTVQNQSAEPRTVRFGTDGQWDQTLH